MKVNILPYDLIFKQAAGTSRGVLVKKRSYFVIAKLDQGIAVGECGLFEGLSADDRPGYSQALKRTLIEYHEGTLDMESLRAWPSIRCGWEMLLADIASGGKHQLLENTFTKGKPIPINGLIWMGEKPDMSRQLSEKIGQGYTCIKLKIGGIAFEDELQILADLRKEFSIKDIEVRLDANGAFHTEEAMEKLNKLSAFDIHSIEQPIAPGQLDKMAELCANSPIPIALDEELIGVHEKTDKANLLQAISPQYIILKPSLVGGFAGSDEWVSLAEDLAIPWWATSALESNIGLNAIAQWTATKSNQLPQGLGTGGLYTNNIKAPLRVARGQLFHDSDQAWNLSALIDA